MLQRAELPAAAELALEAAIERPRCRLAQRRNICVQQHAEQEAGGKDAAPAERACGAAPTAAGSSRDQNACPTASCSATGAPKGLGEELCGSSYPKASSNRTPTSSRTGPIGVG